MGRRKEEWREDRQTRQTTINLAAAAAASAAVKILEAERNLVITSHPGPGTPIYQKQNHSSAMTNSNVIAGN